MWLIVLPFVIIGAVWNGLPGLVMGLIVGIGLYALSVILSA